MLVNGETGDDECTGGLSTLDGVVAETAGTRLLLVDTGDRVSVDLGELLVLGLNCFVALRARINASWTMELISLSVIKAFRGVLLFDDGEMPKLEASSTVELVLIRYALPLLVGDCIEREELMISFLLSAIISAE